MPQRTTTTDKILFTPGPLTTSPMVKRAMLRDLGSRDAEFTTLVRDALHTLLRLAGVGGSSEWVAVPMQGSGTFGVEAMITTAVPRRGRLLVAQNGAYGARMVAMAVAQGIDVMSHACPEDRPVDPDEVAAILDGDATITHVALVHCETTTGIVNPLPAVARVVAERRRVFLVDGMSSFGALDVDLGALPVDFFVSSANKCLEGVPGFSFVLCRRAVLETCADNARSVSLDLHAQWRGLESTHQFRFTPPTHAFLAFAQALRELEEEGGIPARRARYQKNQERIARGMRAMGFETYLAPEVQGCVITTFRIPATSGFSFETLYARLAERGFVIYPGKLTREPCFRIGSAGHIGPAEVDGLLDAVRAVMKEMDADSSARES